MMRKPELGKRLMMGRNKMAACKPPKKSAARRAPGTRSIPTMATTIAVKPSVGVAPVTTRALGPSTSSAPSKPAKTPANK